MAVLRAIGLMSGTSLDGIDAAMIRTDGEGKVLREGFISIPYGDDLRAALRACLNQPEEKAQNAAREMTVAHARAVGELIKKKNMSVQDIDLIGFHGQTISHDPSRKHTCQIGDGALLAKLTGVRVINDFRTADVLAGGQGAPLVPVYHQALASDLEKPIAFLNIGGVANVTYIAADEIIAFDTGPGNALIDDWMLSKAGRKYDAEGAFSMTGKADIPVLTQMISHHFFKRPPPKSLDRNDFVSAVWEHLSTENGAATLTAFTIGSIMQAVKFMPQKPREWIVSGGGRLNKAVMRGLAAALKAPVRPIEEIGLDGDAIEAEAFAYMAVRSYRGLPISFPKTTGVPQPMAGGKTHNVPTDAA
jgi:anhydro-N-acetylmuramic acid kinase